MSGYDTGTEDIVRFIRSRAIRRVIRRVLI